MAPCSTMGRESQSLTAHGHTHHLRLTEHQQTPPARIPLSKCCDTPAFPSACSAERINVKYQKQIMLFILLLPNSNCSTNHHSNDQPLAMSLVSTPATGTEEASKGWKTNARGGPQLESVQRVGPRTSRLDTI